MLSPRIYAAALRNEEAGKDVAAGQQKSDESLCSRNNLDLFPFSVSNEYRRRHCCRLRRQPPTRVRRGKVNRGLAETCQFSVGIETDVERRVFPKRNIISKRKSSWLDERFVNNDRTILVRDSSISSYRRNLPGWRMKFQRNTGRECAW